jgi:integrase
VALEGRQHVFSSASWRLTPGSGPRPESGRPIFWVGITAVPTARRPYDLRHACLSAWLNGGVYPTQVAEWAGHSVDVLLRIYAKCVVGQDELAKRRISEALRQD